MPDQVAMALPVKTKRSSTSSEVIDPADKIWTVEIFLYMVNPHTHTHTHTHTSRERFLPEVSALPLKVAPFS